MPEEPRVQAPVITRARTQSRETSAVRQRLQQAINNNNEGQIAQELPILQDCLIQENVHPDGILLSIVAALQTIPTLSITILAVYIHDILITRYSLQYIEDTLRAKCMGVPDLSIFMCNNTCKFTSSCLCGNPIDDTSTYGDKKLELFFHIFKSYIDGTSPDVNDLSTNLIQKFNLFRELYADNPSFWMIDHSSALGFFACLLNAPDAYNQFVEICQIDPFRKSSVGPSSSGLLIAIQRDYNQMVSTILESMIAHARRVPGGDIYERILNNLRDPLERLRMPKIAKWATCIHTKLLDHNFVYNVNFIWRELGEYFEESIDEDGYSSDGHTDDDMREVD